MIAHVQQIAPDAKPIAAPPEPWATAADVIAFLKLADEGRNPTWMLRNLIRRRRLPAHRVGKLLRFKISEVDAWMAGEKPTPKTKRLARLQGSK